MSRSEDDSVRFKFGTGRIKHELTMFPQKKKISAFQRLLSRCVLSGFRTDLKYRSSQAVARRVQLQYQSSCLRVGRFYALRPLDCMYKCNCQPCGFIAEPKTTFCKDPLACPWCYVRYRLMPVFNAFRAVPLPVRRSLRLSVWSGLPIYDEPERAKEIDSLLSYRKGPVSRLKAAVGVYTSVVRGSLSAEPLREVNGRFYPHADNFSLEWVGISATHADVDVAAVLARLSPRISVLTQGVKFKEDNLLLMMAKNLRYPELLLKSRNIEAFHRYSQRRAGTRLLRIYKYKEK